MIPVWLQIVFYVLSTISAFITITLFLLIKINVDDLEIKFKSTKLLSKLINLKTKIVWLIVASITTAGLIILSVSLSKDNDENDYKEAEVLTSATPTIDQSTSTCYLLNEIDPTIKNHDAFFNNKWSDYRNLIVDHVEYPIGIGIRVPLVKQYEYCTQSPNQRIEHQEVQEYKLCRKYREFTFSYGVDDCSFDGLDTNPPSGISRILMQYANSDRFLAEDENVLYDSGEFVYRLIKHDVTIDVSQVENLRITVYWKYDANRTQRNCLSLAIINPILYLKQS